MNINKLAKIISVISTHSNARLLLCSYVSYAIDNDLKCMCDSIGLTQHVKTSMQGQLASAIFLPLYIPM